MPIVEGLRAVSISQQVPVPHMLQAYRNGFQSVAVFLGELSPDLITWDRNSNNLKYVRWVQDTKALSVTQTTSGR